MSTLCWSERKNAWNEKINNNIKPQLSPEIWNNHIKYEIISNNPKTTKSSVFPQHELTCNTLTRMQFTRLIYWISLLYVKFLDEPQELSREVRSGARRKLAEGERGHWPNKEGCAEVAVVLAGRPELGCEGRRLRGSSPRWDEMQTSENSAERSRTLDFILPTLIAHAHYWWAVAVTEFHLCFITSWI